jgi:hypothetical protein
MTTRKRGRSSTPATGQIPTAKRCLIPGRAKYNGYAPGLGGEIVFTENSLPALGTAGRASSWSTRSPDAATVKGFTAREAGIPYSVALTAAAWARCVAGPPASSARMRRAGSGMWPWCCVQRVLYRRSGRFWRQPSWGPDRAHSRRSPRGPPPGVRWGLSALPAGRGGDHRQGFLALLPDGRWHGMLSPNLRGLSGPPGAKALPPTGLPLTSRPGAP